MLPIFLSNRDFFVKSQKISNVFQPQTSVSTNKKAYLYHNVIINLHYLENVGLKDIIKLQLRNSSVTSLSLKTYYTWGNILEE